MHVEAPPAVFQDGGLNCVTGLGKVAGRLIILLDMSKLLAPGSLQVNERGKKAASKPRHAVPRTIGGMRKNIRRIPISVRRERENA